MEAELKSSKEWKEVFAEFM